MSMAAFGWYVVTVLALAFLAAGALCAVGVSDRPTSSAYKLLLLGLVFAAISYAAFPFG